MFSTTNELHIKVICNCNDYKPLMVRAVHATGPTCVFAVSVFVCKFCLQFIALVATAGSM